jgi:hypothetical protein
MLELVAACAVDNDDVAPVFITNDGFVVSALGKHAVGATNLTLNRAADPEECVCMVTVRGGAGDFEAHLEHITDTLKRVHTTVAGAPSDDVDFDVLVVRTKH